MIINEVLYISGAFLLPLKKDPEFAPDKLRRNTIFCILPKTKKEAVSNKLEIAFFVSAKKIGQVLTSLSQNLPVSLNFCILGNQVNISQR